ncbi:MAG: AmmeMemoRadiSam system protein A [Acidobacteria bacterium]|nr:AmmeMemoRadiSam system protein A [Acidobacteriota bacterium]
MTAPDHSDSRGQRAVLLIGLARQAIEGELGRDFEPPPVPTAMVPWLGQPAATFVTLELDGRLRGCIGSLEAQRSLRDDVTGNARSAAFEDPRFPSLTAQELDGLVVEVSVLSEPEPIECHSEAELLAALRPGVDGLVLECGSHRSTFLPQVWENLSQPCDFLAALKKKARLERDFWNAEMCFSRYTVEMYREK